MNFFSKDSKKIEAIAKLFADANLDLDVVLEQGKLPALAIDEPLPEDGEDKPAEEAPPTDAPADAPADDMPAEPDTPAEPTEEEKQLAEKDAKIAELEKAIEDLQKEKTDAEANAQATSAESLRAMRESAPAVFDAQDNMSTSVYATYQSIKDPKERAQYFAQHRNEIVSNINQRRA